MCYGVRNNAANSKPLPKRAKGSQNSRQSWYSQNPENTFGTHPNPEKKFSSLRPLPHIFSKYSRAFLVSTFSRTTRFETVSVYHICQTPRKRGTSRRFVCKSRFPSPPAPPPRAAKLWRFIITSPSFARKVALQPRSNATIHVVTASYLAWWISLVFFFLSLSLSLSLRPSLFSWGLLYTPPHADDR